MNKLEDKTMVQALEGGYSDFLEYCNEARCQYAPDSQESKYWTMGFEDAFDDQMKITDFSEETE